MGANARALVLRDFHQDLQAQEYLELYRRLRARDLNPRVRAAAAQPRPELDR